MTCVIIKHIFNDTLGLEAGVLQTNSPNLVLSPLLSLLAIKLKTTVSPLLISQLNFMSPNFSHRKSLRAGP